MAQTYTPEVLDALVRRILLIGDITLGSGKDYLVRYRGHLIGDSETAYDTLADLLKPYDLTPLFRWDEDRHAILIVKSVPEPPRSNPWVNLGLFIVTIFSVLLAGGLNSLSDLPTDFLQAIPVLMVNGWPFAVSMLAILGTHELGHYFAGKAHGIKLTLPYFIPLPFGPFGTMGAFINMKSPAKNRRHLMDLAITGPLAGLVVSVIVLIIGLNMSTLNTLPTSMENGMALSMEGNSILYLFLKYITFGKLLPEPASFNTFPVWYWIRYFFTGVPYPLGGTDVMISPVAWAGWVGLLVTSLNLIPAGQLDGGHIFYTLFGKKTSSKLVPYILIALIILGFIWGGWWLWAAIVLFLGRYYAEPLDQITELDPKRKKLGYLGLILFILTFTPVPLTVI